MGEKIGVIGAGSWGTTLANLLAKKGLEVTLWAYEGDLVEEMRATRVNTLFLPGMELSAGLAFTNSLEEAAAGKDVLVLVSPSQVMRSVLTQLAPLLEPGVTLVNASKGIELDTFMTMDQVCAAVLPPPGRRPLLRPFGPQLCPGSGTGDADGGGGGIRRPRSGFPGPAPLHHPLFPGIHQQRRGGG